MKGDEQRVGMAMNQVLSTLAFSKFDQTLVLVMTTKDASPDDWTIWSQACATAAVEHGVRSLIVVSEGGGPNAAQRKQVIEAMVGAVGPDEPDAFRTAICSDSAVARFIAGALGWLYAIRNMKMFASHQQREALQFLGIEHERHVPIIAAIPQIHEALRARQ